MDEYGRLTGRAYAPVATFAHATMPTTCCSGSVRSPTTPKRWPPTCGRKARRSASCRSSCCSRSRGRSRTGVGRQTRGHRARTLRCDRPDQSGDPRALQSARERRRHAARRHPADRPAPAHDDRGLRPGRSRSAAPPSGRGVKNMESERSAPFVYLGSQFFEDEPSPRILELQDRLRAAYPQTQFMALPSEPNPHLLPPDGSASGSTRSAATARSRPANC